MKKQQVSLDEVTLGPYVCLQSNLNMLVNQWSEPVVNQALFTS